MSPKGEKADPGGSWILGSHRPYQTLMHTKSLDPDRSWLLMGFDSWWALMGPGSWHESRVHQDPLFPLDVTNTKIYDCFDLFTKLFWWIIWNFENEFFKIAWEFCSIYYVEVRIHANLKTKILVRLSLIVLKFGEAFASPCLWVPPPMIRWYMIVIRFPRNVSFTSNKSSSYVVYMYTCCFVLFAHIKFSLV